jgi:rhomboid family GlyGly-CTERM serine protease
MIIKSFIITLFTAIALIPEIKNEFRWESTAIEYGEFWRILTGNLTHTNVTHWLGNIFALWGIVFLFKITPFLRLFFMLCLGIGIGLFFTPIQAYVGLSGVLYGLFFYGAIKEKSRILIFLGIGKLIYDQWFNSNIAWDTLINAPIAIHAHWLGAVIGSMIIGYQIKIR